MSPNCFFFNHTATTEIYTLSLHDALPISPSRYSSTVSKPNRATKTAKKPLSTRPAFDRQSRSTNDTAAASRQSAVLDRKSTRLNSSHMSISYAVFCLKKKKKKKKEHEIKR